MPKRMLTTSEVRDLVAILRDLFSHQAQLREIQPLSSHIQFPKIPSLLSESIVFHLIDRKRLLKGEGSPCAGPDFSGHEFGVKSCLKKEPCDAEGIEGGWGCAGFGGRSA